MSKQNNPGRAVADRTNLYDDITKKIVAELEAGRFPWVQP
jgi:antirestriction protein ArdC